MAIELKHLAFIMDGNRRWAKKRDLPTLEGHRQGYETFKKVSQWCLDRGIRILTFWAFSMENWARPKTEVKYLMELLKLALRREAETFYKKNIRFNMLGRLEEFPKEIQNEIKAVIEKTKKNTAGLMNIALSYGGRAEIVDAVKKIVAKGVKAVQVTDKLIQQNLYLPSLAEPDLIIRTSGEQRTSGYLLWESAYSEWYFSEKYWPDFSETDLDEALAEYAKRQRRFGS